KHPTFGVTCTKVVEYCTQHAPDGLVVVENKKCRTEGCGKRLSFGVVLHTARAGSDGDRKKQKVQSRRLQHDSEGTKMADCAQHAPDGMIDSCDRVCSTEVCSKIPSFGV
ncbi:unnamed protein product, partial [Ascophyllum nodosum]